MKMATGCTTTAPYVTNSPVKTIRAKTKSLRNSFFKLMVLAEFALTTFIPTAAFTKASEKKAEDALKSGKPPVVLQLENKALDRQDSLKNNASLQKIQVDDITYMVAPKNMKVTYDYSEKPKEKQKNIFLVDPQVQILNARSYFAKNSEIGAIVNGVNNTISYTVGPAVEFPFYDNGSVTFNQNYSVIDSCSLSPMYPLAKFSKMSYFYMMTPDTTRSAALEMMRQFVVSHGGPYISTVYYAAPAGLPVYDWMFIAAYHLNAQGIFISSPTPKIGAIGFPREWLWPPNHNHLEYLVYGAISLTDIRNYQNQQNYEYTIKGSSLGSYILDQYGVPIPFHECAWVLNAVGITPGATTIPTKFALYQNIPNPFNSQTKLKIDVPKKGMVSVKVYDMLGREVATLVNSSMEPGTYEANYNASNLSSGVYFYRMNAYDFTDAKRMVLIK